MSIFGSKKVPEGNENDQLIDAKPTSRRRSLSSDFLEKTFLSDETKVKQIWKQICQFCISVSWN